MSLHFQSYTQPKNIFKKIQSQSYVLRDQLSCVIITYYYNYFIFNEGTWTLPQTHTEGERDPINKTI